MSGQPRQRRPQVGGEPAATAEPAAPSTPLAADPSPSGSKRRRRRRKKRPSAGTSAAVQPAAQRATTAKGTGKKRKRPKPKAPSKAELAARATSTRKEVSSGGVVYRRAEDGSLEILLAARRTLKGNIAWGLAKGHIEEGESPEDAATREVLEETGWHATIEESLGLTKYFYVWDNVRIRKTVHFFLMLATEGDPADRDDEMEEIRWFPLERALKRAAYRGERDILLRAADIIG